MTIPYMDPDGKISTVKQINILDNKGNLHKNMDLDTTNEQEVIFLSFCQC